MKQNEEFDKLFVEMKQVNRSPRARENSWLALKDRLNKPKRRKVFPAVISLALVAIASFLLVTYLLPANTEQSTDTLSREEVIRGFLEKQYNGPDLEYQKYFSKLMDAREPDEHKEASENLKKYVESTFSEYFIKDAASNLKARYDLFKYQEVLISNNIQLELKNVTIEQDKEYPHIYYPIIELSLINNNGDEISHEIKIEIKFSNLEEPNKIGHFNLTKNSGIQEVELYNKINDFDSYLSKEQQSIEALSNEEAIMGFLEKQYNGPDLGYERLLNDWFDLQGRTKANTQEEYDKLQKSEEATNYIDYFHTTFGEYIREDKIETFIQTNLLFQFQSRLIDHNLTMKLEKVTIKQDENYPNIYRPIIDISLTNNKGQQIFHTLREEFIFSEEEPGKIGSYNWVKDSGGVELYDKMENFNSYLTSGE